MKRNIVFIVLSFFYLQVFPGDFNNNRIQPYSENPYYWQYNGRPVFLIGGSSQDNLFQIENLEEELDLIQSVGGNYVRNTMSSRDAGNVAPFEKSDGLYDPDTFNEEYWKRLERFLELTAERNIFVQIEIWAFHDFTGYWPENSWNPSNNKLFTEYNTNLKTEAYGNNRTYVHNFFHSVPSLNNDVLLLSYQKRFVDKLLSYSLKYDHVLYCITNEIFSQYSTDWGWYWAEYLKNKADESGVGIEVTEMYQEVNLEHDQHKASLDFSETFTFLDMSQNSFNCDQEHWDLLQYVRHYIRESPRPINHTKTYGGQLYWTSGANHGVERFWRNILGGAASTRFHRAYGGGGIGISERAQKNILSASMLAKEYNFFSSIPDNNSDMLFEREPDEAYPAKNGDNDIVVYFPDGGQVILNLTGLSPRYRLRWLNIESAEWIDSRERIIEGGCIFELAAPFKGNWVALLSCKEE